MVDHSKSVQLKTLVNMVKKLGLSWDDIGKLIQEECDDG
jgi:hypothetical protein